MRWDELFADLEGQLEAGLSEQDQEAAAEEERLRLGRQSLRDRVAAMARMRAPIVFRLVDGTVVAVTVRTVGRDWIAGDLPDGAQAVVPLAGVSAVLPSTAQRAATATEPSSGALTERLGVAFVLRDLARRRRRVQIVTAAGATSGTLDRVGRDHVDLAVHPADTWRRETAVARVEILALAQILMVRVD